MCGLDPTSALGFGVSKTPLVVVLPTGGGKSLLFTVPACVEEAGVTVVVVPYRALVEDLVGQSAVLELSAWNGSMAKATWRL